MINMNQPNVLVIMADDHSWPHTGYYGCEFIKTPSLDRIANEGVVFENAFCSSPQCSPARAAVLTGLNMWRLEEGGQLDGLLPKKFKVYPEILEENGYHVGYTGKGWAPGDVKASGRDKNPCGTHYEEAKLEPPAIGIFDIDYYENFRLFMEANSDDLPFCFWMGPHEPHRIYEYGSGVKHGGKLEDVDVPPYLPDTETVRNDLLDYGFEIEWYDRHVGLALDYLKDNDKLENTLIIATGDNGMPFPRAKNNLYIHSCHVPCAIRWGDGIPKPNRRISDLISFTDIAPTILEAVGIRSEINFSGKSLMGILKSKQSGRIEKDRTHVFLGRERHVHCRPDNVSYPMRAIRTDEYLFVKNYEPNRWPQGDPITEYADTDAGPTKSYMLDHAEDNEVAKLVALSFGKRPMYELYDLKIDFFCMENIAECEENQAILEKLEEQLETFLKRELDPRVLGFGEIFDSYPVFMGPWDWAKGLDGFAKIGEYNPEFQEKAFEKLKKILNFGTSNNRSEK